jgi:hypothetical protein
MPPEPVTLPLPVELDALAGALGARLWRQPE